MKAYKIEILVIDFNNLGADGIETELNNVNFANDCITLNVKSITEKDIGEWSDEHPLNQRKTCDTEYRRLFAPN